MEDEINNGNLIIKLVQHGSEEYKETVALRFKILREPLGLAFTETQLASEDNDFHFALYRSGKLGACLVMSPQNNGEIKMRQVAVDEDFQGQGLGKQLVSFTEKWSAGNGYTKIVLHARESAIPFYLGQDYEIIDKPFKEVGIPHRKMIKNLKYN